ncbi:uncharacterized protein [Argopecten irradians]|uniref:uncharacterized protein n=1 Tax=Argopecten irradians TaxID=31199 RepID=UPI00371CA647
MTGLSLALVVSVCVGAAFASIIPDEELNFPIIPPKGIIPVPPVYPGPKVDDDDYHRYPGYIRYPPYPGHGYAGYGYAGHGFPGHVYPGHVGPKVIPGGYHYIPRGGPRGGRRGPIAFPGYGRKIVYPIIPKH